MGKLLLILLVAAACATTGPGDTADSTPRTGKELYQRSCQRCHALYMPRSYTAGEWQFFVRKYGRKARLNSDQKGLVLDYLSRNARQELAAAQARS